MLVRSLDELTAADLPEAGGKGANLGELRRAQFPVPDGFVITTAAYALAAEAAGVTGETPATARVRLAASPVPAGIAEPLLHAAGASRITGRAVVDLDAVRTQKKRTWTDPLGYLSGRLPVTAAGRLTTKDGVGRFELESAEISGVTIPKSLLQELLTYYSRTAERPNGINMDDPFELPSAIREIRVGEGSAAIVQ